MKLLILVVFASTGYCSEDDRAKTEQRQIIGGGNYGGFIGLTTYAAGPFLVKGKYERDTSDEEYGVKAIPNVGYEDIIKENSFNDGRFNVKKDEDYVETLGYDGEYKNCVGRYYDKDVYKGKEYSDRSKQNLNRPNYYEEEIKEKCDKLFGYTGPTANDEPENIIRPCALDDWQCIRKFFATNSKCKPVYGPIPDPLYIDINTIFLPLANATLTLPNLKVRGLSSAKIRELYLNKKSNNLVFVIDVTNLNQTIPRAYVRFRRTAKESIVLADYATVEFSSLTFTAVIPNAPDLRLDLADIHVDAADSFPKYFVGPGALNSTDPDVITAFADFNLFLPISVREALVFQSQLFTSIYIQNNICDFGLKIVSV